MQVDKSVASHSHVLDEGGDDVWDATLNQTNIGQNNNKFFILQLLEDDKTKKYTFFTRWGRVGASGQKKLEPCESLEKAKVKKKSFFI